MVLFGPLRQSLLIGLFFTVNEKYEPLAEAILYHLCRWLLLSSLSLTQKASPGQVLSSVSEHRGLQAEC